MSERAKIARRARVSVIRACWPLSFDRTVFVCTALLAMCGTNDKQLDPSHSVVFEAGCERKDSSSTQQPIAALQNSMHMLHPNSKKKKKKKKKDRGRARKH